MPNKFVIEPNEYLSERTAAYYSVPYYKFQAPNNPDYLNVLKNTFLNEDYRILYDARDTVQQILVEDLLEIVKDSSVEYVIVSVPRSKKTEEYYDSQLVFVEAIQNAITQIRDQHNIIIEDATDCILRTANTRTTHLPITTGRITKAGNIDGNDGDKPYPGITLDTCIFNSDLIYEREIILIDDIYTKTVNIDEDCIQALYDIGAKSVIFYAVAATQLKDK